MIDICIINDYKGSIKSLLCQIKDFIKMSAIKKSSVSDCDCDCFNLVDDQRQLTRFQYGYSLYTYCSI